MPAFLGRTRWRQDHWATSASSRAPQCGGVPLGAKPLVAALAGFEYHADGTEPVVGLADGIAV